MANLKEVLLAELGKIEQRLERCSETLKHLEIPHVLGTITQHLNKKKKDRFSLAVSGIWGGEVRPEKFALREYFYPESQYPRVAVTGSTDTTIQDNKSSWFYPPKAERGLFWIEAGYDDPDKLFLVVRVAKIRGDTFKEGEARFFELTQTQTPEDLVQEIVDLLVEPKKDAVRKVSLDFDTF